MRGTKLLFLELWDEFKTLIGGGLWDHDVESMADNYRTNTICNDVAEVGTGCSKLCVSEYKKGHPYKKWYQTKKGRKRFATRLTHILGIAAVVIYFVQMQANRRQAKAAEDQLRDIRDAQRLDERAWVAVFQLEPKFNDDGELYYVIKFKNTGKTPAVKVMTFDNFTSDINRIPQMDTRGEDWKDSGGLIAPEAEGEMVTSWNLIPTNGVQAIKSGTAAPLYLWGTIWYDDIFGSNHWSQFCYKINKTLSGNAIISHFSCDDVEKSQAKK